MSFEQVDSLLMDNSCNKNTT